MLSNLQDELALRDLMARYVDAVNRSEAAAWGATWAEDGVWSLSLIHISEPTRLC